MIGIFPVSYRVFEIGNANTAAIKSHHQHKAERGRFEFRTAGIVHEILAPPEIQ
jgi:hypothetical protein